MIAVRPYQIIIDTNVLVAGLRSNLGASYRLLRILNDNRWRLNVSVALVLEYEEILKRESVALKLSFTEIEEIVDALCSIANCRAIPYQWRPLARDPDDDHIAELALNINADFVVTFNQKDLAPLQSFGISVLPPKQFLIQVGEIQGGD